MGRQNKPPLCTSSYLEKLIHLKNLVRYFFENLHVYQKQAQLLEPPKKKRSKNKQTDFKVCSIL